MNAAPNLDTDIAVLAHGMREMIIDMASSAAGAHIGGSLSITDVLAVLFHRVMNLSDDDEARDRFVLSKGHCAVALYSVLVQCGFLEREEIATYAQNGSRLGGHPSMKIPGVEFPTGSLGHGLALGVGLSLGIARAGGTERSFVVLGDGELQEGSVWEAAASAARLGLSKLCAIVDRNRLQITGHTEHWLPDNALGDRWRSFGWRVETCDGHDHEALSKTILQACSDETRPGVVIANTVKGRGLPFLADNKKCHYVKLTPRLRARALRELQECAP